MSRYRDQVAGALDAVTILGPRRYAWLGRPRRRFPAELDGPALRGHLVACLREELYCSFYCHGRPVPARWGEASPDFPDPDLASALSAANCGGGSWDPGWTVQRRGDDGAVVVTNARLRVRLPRCDYRPEGGTDAPGAAVSIRLPKELPARSPGFYTVVGDAVADRSSPAGTVRVYWNVTRAGAAALVGAITARLNRAEVPFRLKVADHPFRFQRCDAAVLYLQADAFRVTRDTLGEIASTHRGQLEAAIPAFTLRLAPGVGLAEDDGGGGESFGERRCALLADGIVRAHEQASAGPAARLDAVAARFAQDGVQIDAPYLEPSLAGRHVL
jgi:hypothetical protein